MNDQAVDDSLELEVRDFGPIVKAKIKLRPLTVLVGPSNTGKSYMAMLIYALHRHFSSRHNTDHPYSGHDPVGFINPITNSKKTRLKRAAIDRLTAWATQELKTWNAIDSLTNEIQLILPPSVTQLMHFAFDTQGELLCREISRCFGSNLDQMIRQGSSSGGRVVIQSQHSNSSVHFELGLSSRLQEQRFSLTVPDSLEIRFNFTKSNYSLLFEFERQMRQLSLQEGEAKRYVALKLLAILTQIALPKLVGSLALPAFYLPASRTGVMHAHSVVVSALIGSATMTGLRPGANMPMLSGVLADFLEQLLNLNTSRHRRINCSEDIAANIENSILFGSVNIKKAATTGYPRFTYQPDGWENSLPMMNASSMVSELAPIVLYLRHRVEPGNVLIVEEPEAHLHPAMQVEFIRQLAALVRSGVRVVVTTHSEWVLEELSNIIARSKKRTLMMDDIVAINFPGARITDKSVITVLIRGSKESPMEHWFKKANLAKFIKNKDKSVTLHMRREQLAKRRIKHSDLKVIKEANDSTHDIALLPSKVGAWLFETKSCPKGSVVTEIPFDKDSGLYPSGFDDVAAALHNDWADIDSRIGETK